MLKTIAKIATGGALLVPAFLSINLYFPFISGKAFFFRSLIQIAFVAYLLHLLFLKKRKQAFSELSARLKHPLVIAVSVFALLFVIAAFFSVNPVQSFWSNFERGEGAFQMIHYYLFFILLASLFSEKRDIETLFVTTIFVSVIASIYGFMQWAGLDGILGNGNRISGTLGNPSYLAAYNLFSLGFLLYFFTRAKQLSTKLLLLIPAALLLLALLKTGTKGAILGLLAAILVFFIVNALRRNAGKAMRTASLVLLLIALASASLFFVTHENPNWQKVPFLGQRFFNLENTVLAFQPRLWSWGSALAGVLERPVLGWGPENFAYSYDKYYNAGHFGKESFFDRTHNLYLEILLAGGILLLASFVSMLYFAFREIFKQKKTLWFSILLSIPIAYLVQAFFLFDVLVITLCFYTLLASILHPKMHEEDEIELEINWLKTSIILLLSLALILAFLNPSGGSISLEFSSITLLAAMAITIFYKKEKADYIISSLDSVIALGLLAVMMTVSYSTTYLPLQKNKLIAKTFTPNLSTEQKFDIFDRQVLNFQSPIGQEEAVLAYNSFALGIAQDLARPNGGTASEEFLNALTTTANNSFDNHRDIMPGLRQTYVNGAFNITLGNLYQNPELLERGRTLYEDALELAPSRIEFMRLLLQLAQIEQDQETFNHWRTRAQTLRPDLDWPVFQAQTQASTTTP